MAFPDWLRNVTAEDDGTWAPGGTYTFEFYHEYNSTFFLWDYASIVDLYVYLGEDESNVYAYGILFTNDNSDGTGMIDTTTYGEYYSLDYGDGGENESGWKLGTITIPNDLPDGTYYLKHVRLYVEVEMQ